MPNYPMLLLLFTWILCCTSCLAVIPGSSGHNDQPSIRSTQQAIVDPIARWIDLYKQIYDPDLSKIDTLRRHIDLATLKSLIYEMSFIERSKAFQIGLKPLIKSGNYKVKQYQEMIAKFYSTNVLHAPNASITDLLMQTFDYNSNDCTMDYFERLNDIQSNFKDNPQITIALQESRDLQYKNCWTRYMESLSANCMSIGFKAKTVLNNLVGYLHVNSNEIINYDEAKNSEEFSDVTLGAKIAQYLARTNKPAQTNQSDSNQFEYLIVESCRLLIDETKEMIMKVLKFLDIIQVYVKSERFMTKEHALILNRYLLCEIIIANSEQIGLNVTHFIKNPNPSTELRLNVLQEDDNLITQREFQQDLQNDENDLDYYRKVQSKPGYNTKNLFVLRIDKGTCRGKHVKYPVHWSDGSQTMETKANLLEHWPVEYDIMQKRTSAEKQARYIKRCIAKRATESGFSELNKQLPPAKRQRTLPKPTQPPAPLITINFEPEHLAALQANIEAGNARPDTQGERVIEIKPGDGRGASYRYQAIWSNGLITSEKKDYLEKNWPEVWAEFRQDRNDLTLEKYETRLIDTNKQPGFSAPRIPFLATLEQHQQLQKRNQQQQAQSQPVAQMVQHLSDESDEPSLNMNLDLNVDLNPESSTRHLHNNDDVD